jgi:hypothetical protein
MTLLITNTVYQRAMQQETIAKSHDLALLQRAGGFDEGVRIIAI